MPDPKPEDETAPTTNTDDGEAGTLDLPRESDEGGEKDSDPVPDA